MQRIVEVVDMQVSINEAEALIVPKRLESAA